MEIIRAPEAMAEWTAKHRGTGASIGFVPTMGALHEGHLVLVRRARKECAKVVCSIFVNPLQFNDPQDLANYPVRTEADRALLEADRCDALFLPDKAGIFNDFAPRHYDLGGLDGHWEGPLRPGHFQGVVNVVERLFFYVRPDRAYFGEKDRQQLAILQHVARALRWPERIVPCPTVRENDGLALSSRNLRLNPAERAAAPVLYAALRRLAEGGFAGPMEARLEQARATVHREPLAQLEYLGVADPVSLAPLKDWPVSGPVVALIAARVGPVRLIDNLTFGPDGPVEPSA